MDKSYVTPFNPDDTIDLGGRVFECVMVPGHTVGSNVLYEVETHVAFPGDAVGSGNSVWLLDSVYDYDRGVHALLDVIDSELGGEVKLYTDHTWQAFVYENEVTIDRQYVADMCSILDNIKSGGDYAISRRVNMKNMDIYASYGKALISVNRQKLCSWALESGKPLRVFNDVSGDALIEAVAHLYANGVTSGTGLLTYAPEQGISRAELLTMLANAVKAEVDDAAVSGFSDVSAGQWYTGYVAWGHEVGLMAGNENYEFRPLEPMAEAEINELLNMSVPDEISVGGRLRLREGNAGALTGLLAFEEPRHIFAQNAHDLHTLQVFFYIGRHSAV